MLLPLQFGSHFCAQAHRAVPPRLPLAHHSVTLSGTLKTLETMPRLHRRAFLSAAAAMWAAPGLAATMNPSTQLDVVIVGAGAAGIAAARRIAAAGRRYVVLEAAAHIGGRCVTDTRIFGVPYDLGAHWIHMPNLNPLTKLAVRRGIEVYPAPAGQKLRIGRRYAREGEMEDFLAAQERGERAIIEAARKADIACEQVLPNDLGEWRPSVEFVLGPYGCAKDLAQVSTLDFAKSEERDVDAFCRQGFGALLAAQAEGLAINLSVPVTAIDTRHNVAVETPNGTITARAAIVTVSTNVITSGAIKFTPDLAARPLEAFAKLSLGSYDHIALELAGNPLGFESDDLVFEKASDARTAGILANVSGTSLCLIEVGGGFDRDLSAQGEAAMIDFAAEWLAGLYGADVKKAIKRSHATRWDQEPLTRGAFSAAAPGWQKARRMLMEPVNDSVWFAGEAVHEDLWATVGGAWESGDRAADAVLRRLGPARELPAADTAASAKPKPKWQRTTPRQHFGATRDESH
jgi:monoamine oxidase